MADNDANKWGGKADWIDVPPDHDDRAIISRLLRCIIASQALISIPLLQHGEFLIQVLVQEGEKRDGWDEDIVDKGVDYGREC